MKTTSIILTDKQVDWLDTKCVNVSNLVRKLLEDYIKKNG